LIHPAVWPKQTWAEKCGGLLSCCTMDIRPFIFPNLVKFTKFIDFRVLYPPPLYCYHQAIEQQWQKRYSFTVSHYKQQASGPIALLSGFQQEMPVFQHRINT